MDAVRLLAVFLATLFTAMAVGGCWYLFLSGVVWVNDHFGTVLAGAMIMSPFAALITFFWWRGGKRIAEATPSPVRKESR